MSNPNEKPDIASLEDRVGDLEGLADELANAPDEELVEALNRAVSLLGEVNADIEAGISAADDGLDGVSANLDRPGFGDFDVVLGEIEEQERAPGE